MKKRAVCKVCGKRRYIDKMALIQVSYFGWFKCCDTYACKSQLHQLAGQLAGINAGLLAKCLNHIH